MPSPFFFFSYARRDAGAELDQFFRDLEDRAAKPGFRDQVSIEIGERWSPALDEALRTCKAFVAIYSPAYFESEYCGKEWAAFRSRYEERMAQDDEPAPLILPVFWKGLGALSLPPAADEVQYHQEALPESYVEKGLLSLLEGKGTEYGRVVKTLAEKMTKAVEAHELAPYRLRFDFARIPSAFREDGARAGRRDRMLREQFEGYLRTLWSRLNPLPLHQVSGRSAERESIPLPAVYTALQTTAELSVEKRDAKSEPIGQSPLKLDPRYVLGLTEAVAREAAASDARGEPLAPRRGREPEGSEEGWSVRRSLTALEAAAGCPRLVLLGAPGSGKSTFARYLALCHAGQVLGEEEANLARLNGADSASEAGSGASPSWPHGALLPVFVELAHFVGSGAFPKEGDRAEAGHLTRYLKERGADPSSPQLVEAIQEAMRRPHGALLILDGLDETPNAEEVRDRLRDVIRSFTEEYRDCRVLVTSRPYAYERESSWRLDAAGFENATLAPLDEEAIQAFIRSWFGYQARKNVIDEDKADAMAEAMWSNLETETYLRPLAERPLMLTMMADLHSSRGGSLRGGRAELYEKGVELLLDRWNERREGRTASESLGMTPDRILAALEDLAYRVHKVRGATTPSEAVEIDAGELFEALDSHRPEKTKVDQREVINYLHQRSGILLAESPRRYRFPHRSYQEYLAARYITREFEPDDLLLELTGDPMLWREVALLAAGRIASGPQPYQAWTWLETLVPNEPPAVMDRDDPAFFRALLSGLAIRENGLHERVRSRDERKLENIRLWLQRALGLGALPVLDRAEAGRVLGAIGDRRRGVGLRDDGAPDIDWVEIGEGPFLVGSAETDEMADGDEKPQRELTLPAFRMARFPLTNAQYRAFVNDGGYTEGRRDCWSKAGWQWRGDRKGPDDGLPSVFLLDNHPRVNVSWFEADAYCRWLGQRLGHSVRLPTEEEWEKAARGTDGRIFPWGNDFDASKCNMVSTDIGSTSAVGMFPEGKSPYEVLDASGNVWEWTGSKLDKEEDDERASRVLRGGSFNNSEWYVRCAARVGYDPDLAHDDVGFRVCAPVRASGV